MDKQVNVNNDAAIFYCRRILVNAISGSGLG